MDTGFSSYDATLLKSYTTKGLKRIGIDPIGNKFKKFYTDGLELIPDFFSKDIFNKKYGKAKAKIITSIAMFYDLENPKKFVLDILIYALNAKHIVIGDDFKFGHNREGDIKYLNS